MGKNVSKSLMTCNIVDIQPIDSSSQEFRSPLSACVRASCSFTTVFLCLPLPIMRRCSPRKGSQGELGEGGGKLLYPSI